MPLLAYNLTGAPVVLTGITPAVTLPASASPPNPGPAVNVTSELMGLAGPAYVLLEAQATGVITYAWSGGVVEYATPGLTVTTGGGGGGGGLTVLPFGTGIDGDATLAGGVLPDRYLHYQNLTITGPVTMSGFFPVFVSNTLTIAPGGSLSWTMPAPLHAAAEVPGTGAITHPTGRHYFYRTLGLEGGAGGNAGPGTPFNLLLNMPFLFVPVGYGFGGQGGAVEAWDVSSIVGFRMDSAIGATPLPLPSDKYADNWFFRGNVTGGGGDGGAGGAGGLGGGGGGGGEAGRLLHLLAKTVVNNGTISSDGVDGGDGGDATVDGTGGGAGGGGAGGVIFIATTSYSGTGTMTVLGGAGGTGGALAGAGVVGLNGQPGQDGYIYIWNISNNTMVRGDAIP